MDKKEADVIKRLGAKIRKERLARDLTLEDMSDYGFSPQHFQKIESGKKSVSFYTVVRIAKAFKINVSELVKVSDP